MHTLRILHVNDYLALGGAELLMHRTVHLLRAHGHDARIFTSASVPRHRRSAFSYLNNRRARAALANTVLDFQPHIVHLHNFYHELSPGILAEIHALRLDATPQYPGPSVCMTAHDYHLLCPSPGCTIFPRREIRPVDPARLQRLSYLLFNRWDSQSRARSTLRLAQHLLAYRLQNLLRAIDRILAPSRFLCGLLQQRNLPAHWLPNPAPLVPRGARHASRPERLHLVFAGRIAPEKGIVRFITQLPPDLQCQLTVIGDGPDLPRARAAASASKHPSSITFLGQRSHDETLHRIAAAHLLVLPALWFENDPLSLLEALSLNTSILVSDLGPMPEIVRDSGTGFSYSPADPASLHAVLRNVHSAHLAGSLNAFDASPFLSSRSESAYIHALLGHYAALLPQSTASAPVHA